MLKVQSDFFQNLISLPVVPLAAIEISSYNQSLSCLAYDNLK